MATEVKRDYWVDGHFISAATPNLAHLECFRLYGHDAEKVRPWTDADND